MSHQQQQQQQQPGVVLCTPPTPHSPFVLAGSACPYDLDTTPDQQSLLRRHQKYQVATLMGSSPAAPTRAPVVLVNSNHLVGLGNRVPAVVTGEGSVAGGVCGGGGQGAKGGCMPVVLVNSMIWLGFGTECRQLRPVRCLLLEGGEFLG